MKELKPCPFCGGHPLIGTGLNEVYVYCKKCRARTRGHNDEDSNFLMDGDHINYFSDNYITKIGENAILKAIESWNRRVNDAPN